MIERRCYCVACRSWRIAVYLAICALLAIIITAALSLPARAETIVVCEKVELPGKDHTLNPFDPPAKQRQEKVSVCSQVEVPDHNRLGPIVDRKHDPRSWA